MKKLIISFISFRLFIDNIITYIFYLVTKLNRVSKQIKMLMFYILFYLQDLYYSIGTD